MVEVDGSDWCILRTQSPQTLGLAQALTEAGYRAWTPTEVIVRRARRAIPRQELTVALMPGMVFAGWDQLSALLELSRSSQPYRTWDADLRRMVLRGVPYFRILRLADRYARVGDRELSGVRMAESLRAVRVKRQTMKAGAQVRMIGGLLDGLLGTIETVQGRFAQVRFPGWHMPVATALHLLEDVRA